MGEEPGELDRDPKQAALGALPGDGNWGGLHRVGTLGSVEEEDEGEEPGSPGELATGKAAPVHFDVMREQRTPQC